MSLVFGATALLLLIYGQLFMPAPTPKVEKSEKAEKSEKVEKSEKTGSTAMIFDGRTAYQFQQQAI